MTVPPADPADLRVKAAAWRLAVGLIAWVIYFVALVIVYLIAFHRNIAACQQAAAWGLSISLTVALLAIPVAFERPDVRSGSQSRRPPTWAGVVLAGSLLTAGSVAVIWVAMNLTFAGRPAGAWVLTLPATASAITILVSRGGWRIGHRTSGGAAVPFVSMPRPPVADGAAPTAVQLPVEVAAAPAPPTADEMAAEVVAPRPAGLLNPDWPARIGSNSLAVALDSGFWRAAVLALAKPSTEQGGVALVARFKEVLLILGAIFPSQVGASSTHCEFSTVEVERVRHALDSVADELGIAPGDVTVTWVHTHPGLGVFLSGTDRSTSRYWRELDPEFTPIVIDISKNKLTEQIGVFNADGHRLSPMRVVDGLVDEWAMLRLGKALFGTYHADGQPEPLVLFAGSAR